MPGSKTLASAAQADSQKWKAIGDSGLFRPVAIHDRLLRRLLGDRGMPESTGSYKLNSSTHQSSDGGRKSLASPTAGISHLSVVRG